MRYFANCDYFGGEFKWYIGDKQTGKTICTAKNHSNLVTSLKKYLKRNQVSSLKFQWENDNSVQEVCV